MGLTTSLKWLAGYLPSTVWGSIICPSGRCIWNAKGPPIPQSGVWSLPKRRMKQRMQEFFGPRCCEDGRLCALMCFVKACANKELRWKHEEYIQWPGKDKLVSPPKRVMFHDASYWRRVSRSSSRNIISCVLCLELGCFICFCLKLPSGVHHHGSCLPENRACMWLVRP